MKPKKDVRHRKQAADLRKDTNSIARTRARLSGANNAYEILLCDESIDSSTPFQTTSHLLELDRKQNLGN